MFCRKCGFKLEDRDNYCPRCGNKVEPLLIIDADDAEVTASMTESTAHRELPFDESEPSYNNEVQNPQTEEADFDKTLIYRKEETDFLQDKTVIPEENQMPEAQEVLDFSDDDCTVMPEQTEPSEDETVALPAQEKSLADPAEECASDESLFDEEKTDIPIDDTYNIYSGAIPGVSSQDFRYPTNDNAYPDLTAPVTPELDSMAQQFYGDATVGMDCTPTADNINPDQQEVKSATEDAKSKNTAMWIIIACISIIIIAIGATCAVILTQYDSFGEFFASFTDSKDDRDDEDDDKVRKDKTNTDKTITESEAIKELSTETVTVEETTLPPTTEKLFDGYCGTQVYYDFDNASKVLTISGVGEMQNYANTVTPWAGKEVRRVEIGEGVTSIAPGAFTEITPDVIYLSATVSSFDVLAVNKFGSIEVSPSNRHYKGVNGVLFDKSGSILIAYPNQKINTSYAIPEGVKIINGLAFYEATNLTSLSISSTVEYIDSYAFKGCVNIHRLDVPVTVTEIRSGVFYGWTQSQKINIFNSRTRVVEDWNEGCSAEITVA